MHKILLETYLNIYYSSLVVGVEYLKLAKEECVEFY